MLASSLMRQQIRCIQNVNKQALFKAPKTTSTLVPAQFLATTAVQRSSGDHVKMWTAERAVSVAQIPALLVPFMWTTPMTDAIFCTLAVLHSHWGKFSLVILIWNFTLESSIVFFLNHCSHFRVKMTLKRQTHYLLFFH